MKNKYLYQFTVPKIEEAEIVEIRKEGDQEVKVTKKEKKVVEKKFGIFSPKRSMLEEGEMYYAARVSENIKAGILPTSILIRKFDSDGGFLSDGELKYQNSLKTQGQDLNREIVELSASLEKLKAELEKEKSETKQKEIEDKEQTLNNALDQFYEVQEELLKIQQTVESFFEQSAEIKARNKTIIWWILNLSYDLNEAKEELFFKGRSIEDKLRSLDDLEESEEEFTSYLIKKFSYLISYWYSSKISKAEQYEDAERNFRLISGVKEYDETIEALKLKSEQKPESVKTESVKTESVKTESVKPEEVKVEESKPVEPALV